MSSFPPDIRDSLYSKLDDEIQRVSFQKDPLFRLEGSWKVFKRIQNGFKIFAVDGAWIRHNVNVLFAAGGHGLVHEFIPMDEIWVNTHHYHESEFSQCGCIVSDPNQPVSQAYFDSTVIHEITEYLEMNQGKKFWEAHHIALEKEREIGLIPDPWTDS